MKDSVRSVKRLLSAIDRNSDEQVIKVLAHYLHYQENQLREDINEIRNVVIKEREEDDL